MDYFKQLLKLEKNKKYSISKIEWWLLKYSEEYKNTYDFVQTQHWTKQEDGTEIRLPPFWEQSQEDVFLELYSTLEKVSEFHRNEEYLGKEIKTYHKLKKSLTELKKWTAKNEALGAEEYLDFYLSYLEYSENPSYLQVCLNPILNKDYIYIDLLEFKNTMEFIEIFDELYWVKRILPESLEKLKNGVKTESDFTRT